MATTPNYSWPTPDDTDLVRDGAAAIRALGSAVDTTVFANSTAVPDIGIDDLNDVSASSPSDGDLLVYSSAGTAYVSAADTTVRVNNLGTSGTAVTVDLSDGAYQHVAIGTATDVTVSGFPTSGTGGYVVLEVEMPDPEHAVTWPAAVEWDGDDPPALGPDTRTRVVLFSRDAGTTVLGSYTAETDIS
jgi:hypothetical protein